MYFKKNWSGLILLFQFHYSKFSFLFIKMNSGIQNLEFFIPLFNFSNLLLIILPMSLEFYSSALTWETTGFIRLQGSCSQTPLLLDHNGLLEHCTNQELEVSASTNNMTTTASCCVRFAHRVFQCSYEDDIHFPDSQGHHMISFHIIFLSNRVLQLLMFILKHLYLEAHQNDFSPSLGKMLSSLLSYLILLYDFICLKVFKIQQCQFQNSVTIDVIFQQKVVLVEMEQPS